MNAQPPSDLFTLIVAMSSSVAIVIGAWFAVVKLIAPAAKKVKEISEHLDNFLEDWKGVPERDGRDAIPGVMQRLNKIDGELTHNGGSSVKDAVARIEKAVVKINERLEEGDEKFDEIEHRLDDQHK